MPRSIDDFTAARSRPKRWADTLTDEQQAAILDAWRRGYGKHSIANWLIEDWGIEDASPSKIDSFIRSEGAARA